MIQKNAFIIDDGLSSFYVCSMFKTQRDIWKHLMLESGLINKEVQKFVNTGQVDIVDRYLSRAQYEESETAYAGS